MCRYKKSEQGRKYTYSQPSNKKCDKNEYKVLKNESDILKLTCHRQLYDHTRMEFDSVHLFGCLMKSNRLIP